MEEGVSQRERERNRQTDRHRVRQTKMNGQTSGQTDKQNGIIALRSAYNSIFR